MARLLGTIARMESEKKSDRVRRARLQDAKAGKPNPGGPVPWGFQADRVTHDPDQVAEIRDAAHRLLAGESLRSVAKRLGKARQIVRYALQQPRMVGLRQHGDRTYPAAWEPVLDDDTWKAVKAVLKRPEPGGVAARSYLLTGFARCGKCDGAMEAAGARYRCSVCNGVVRTATPVEDYVRDELLKVADVAAPPVTVDPALQAAVKGYEARRDELQEALSEPGAPVASLVAALADVEAKLAAALDALDLASEEWELTAYWAEDDDGKEVWALRGEEAARRAWWDDADLRQKRALVARYVASVTILPKGRGRVPFDGAREVRIEWREGVAQAGDVKRAS